MRNCLINISFGEMIDKITILQIKMEKIRDFEKLALVEKELEYLMNVFVRFNLDKDIFVKASHLKKINEKLWGVEDKIREKEIRNEFDEEFISLARDVYKTNDERNTKKNEINELLNSDIYDVKSYKEIV